MTDSRTQQTYDRLAPIYDWIEAPMEALGGRRRRRRVIARAQGRVLEVGIGTGRNLHLYPPDVEVTGIDLSAGMLQRARHRGSPAAPPVHLEQADAERLPFADGTFDSVTATCVFCSVDDPIRGLREAGRVLRPDGRVLLLEHVRPEGRFLGKLFDWLSPLVRRLMGPEINRRTEENVEAAGFEITGLRRTGIWREIEARPATRESDRS